MYKIDFKMYKFLSYPHLAFKQMQLTFTFEIKRKKYFPPRINLYFKRNMLLDFRNQFLNLQLKKITCEYTKSHAGMHYAMTFI